MEISKTYTLKVVREGGNSGSWPLTAKSISEAKLEVDAKGMGFRGAVPGDVFEICDESGAVVASRPFRSRGQQLANWSS